MNYFHRFFLVIFLCGVFFLPTRAHAAEEKKTDKLELKEAYKPLLECSELSALCDKQQSVLLPSVKVPEEVKKQLEKKALSKPASLDAERLFAMINEHRKNLGLPAFEKEEKLCKLAESRGPELYDEIFVNGNIHGGLYDRNLPYWITENMISLPTLEEAMNWWLNSSLHRRAIEGDYKYSCGVCYGRSCAQLFTNYVPKQSLPVESSQTAAGARN